MVYVASAAGGSWLGNEMMRPSSVAPNQRLPSPGICTMVTSEPPRSYKRGYAGWSVTGPAAVGRGGALQLVLAGRASSPKAARIGAASTEAPATAASMSTRGPPGG